MVSLALAIRLIRFRVLCGSLFTVILNLWLAVGSLEFLLFLQFTQQPGLIANNHSVAHNVAVMATLTVLGAVAGHVASFRKMRRTLWAYAVPVLGIVAFAVHLANRMLVLARGVDQVVAGFTPAERLQASKDLHLEGDAEDHMTASIQDTLYWLFTLFAAVACTGLVLLFSLVLFVTSVSKVRALLSPAGIMMAKAEARAVMVTSTLQNQDTYDMDLTAAKSENLRTKMDVARSRARVAAKMVGRGALARKLAGGASVDGGDGDGCAAPVDGEGDPSAGNALRAFKSRVHPAPAAQVKKTSGGLASVSERVRKSRSSKCGRGSGSESGSGSDGGGGSGGGSGSGSGSGSGRGSGSGSSGSGSDDGSSSGSDSGSGSDSDSDSGSNSDGGKDTGEVRAPARTSIASSACGRGRAQSAAVRPQPRQPSSEVEDLSPQHIK